MTQDTVDNDIFEMQERKAKMNAAIMENNESSSTSEWNKQAQQNVLRTAVDRYLKSPPTTSTHRSEKMLDDSNNCNSNKQEITNNTSSKEQKQDSSGIMEGNGLCKENTDNAVVGLSDSTDI